MKVLQKVQQHNDDEYEVFLSQIQGDFSDTIAKYGGKLFTTDAVELFDTFLGALPVEVRQHYTCNACRRFVDGFGGLVTITSDGKTIPVMWPAEVPPLYQNSVDAVKRLVLKAKVTSVFLNPQSVWGQPVTGEWHHMAVTVNGLAFRQTVQTAFQVMAEKKEDYKTLITSLVEFPLAAVEQAITLLKTDSLYRSEKCLGVAEWLADLHRKRSTTKNQIVKNNLTWLAVATAPAGYCHIRSTMIGTLLEDIVAGLPFEAINRRFAEKMYPLQYQRPQALPSVGNKAQAEKIVAQLQAEGSLTRRFARLDEIKTIWQPIQREEKPASEGVFSHLKTKGQKQEITTVKVPAQTMTWVKFLQTVLPDAEKIEFYISDKRENYAALVTAVNQDAPPILQWDFEDNRNPVSQYVYHNGSHPSQWELNPGYCNVTGICFTPSMWNGNFAHHNESVIFILEGAKDTKDSGNALFPEILKSEFHSIRATIEAYAQTALITGREEASACGIKLQKGAQWNYIFRVISKLGQIEYRLDRWD